MTAIGAASNGMTAAATRLGAAASNIANAASAGPVACGAAAQPQRVCRTVHAVQPSLLSGGLDLSGEVVDQASALAAFKANVASFEAADAMIKALLDLKA